MTNEDLIIAILQLVFIVLLTWLLARDTASSHRGATEPSPLPPPPKTHSGPWYMHIVFLDDIDTPDLYLKADDMQSIVAEPKTHRLLVTFGDGERTFRNVSRYSFERLSQMGEWLMTEEDINE